MPQRGIRVGLVLCGLLFFSRLSHAEYHFEDFKTKWMDVLPAGLQETKPRSGKPPLAVKVFAGNTPQGRLSRPPSPGCTVEDLEQALQHEKTLQTRSVATETFFNRCDKVLNRFPPQRYMAFFKVLAGHYPLEGYSHLREVVFKMPYDTTIHGMLALKDLSKPRPLLIAICGSGCNLSESMARVLLVELFDPNPFNVLVLPSLSGTDFIKDNKGFGLGGFEEGRQTFEIVRLLGGVDSPLRNLISSFQIIGTSLGGNGALFTAAYGTYNNDLLAGPKIQSVIGFCPVVDLKTSLEDLDRNDFTGRHFSTLISETVIKNIAIVLGADAALPEKFKPGHHQSVPFIEKHLYPRYRYLSQRQEFQLAPFSQGDLNSTETFWSANNFLNFYSKVKIPTMVLYSNDDFVVSPKHNAIALAKANQENSNPYLTTVGLKQGSHCATFEVYGEDFFGAVIRNFILSHSPEYNFEANHKSLRLSVLDGVKSFKLARGEKFYGYTWSVPKGKSVAVASVKYWSRDPQATDGCSQWNPYYMDLKCFDTLKIQVPLKFFFSEFENGETPSREKAQELTRWLNHRARILTANRKEPVETTDAPAFLEWTTD